MIINGLLIVVFVASCSKSDNVTGLTKVTVRLPWLFNNEAAGLFVAKEKGYYKKENLDVIIKPGGVGIDPTQLVMSRGIVIGIADGAAVIRARAKGVPIKAFAVEFQDSPLCYVALEETGIKNVKDFRGKKIGTQTFQVYVLEAMLSANQMGLNDIKMIPVQFDLRPLLEGQVDTFLSFETDQPIFIEMRGHKVNIIRAKDNGYHFYSNAIFATDETINDQADVLKKFLRATFKGWKYAFENKEETIDLIISSYNRELDREQQIRGLTIIEEIMTNKVGIANIGKADSNYWQEGVSLLKKYKQIDNDVKVDDVFTMKILDEL